MTVKSGFDSLIETVKKSDPYSQNINNLFDNGSWKLNSCVGVLAGICLTVLVILYAHVKMQILLDYSYVPIL